MDGRCYYFHFKDEEIEEQRRWVKSPPTVAELLGGIRIRIQKISLQGPHLITKLYVIKFNFITKKVIITYTGTINKCR